jgi:hypothetical protein
MSDKKEKIKISLLIYSPPKNSTLNIRSYFFIKFFFFFYIIIVFTLHWNDAERGPKLN